MATYLRLGSQHSLVSTIEIGNIDIIYSLKNIKNYGKKNTSYTKPITLLRTKDTDSVFIGLNNISLVDGYDISKKAAATIIKDGLEILKGSAQVVNITATTIDIVVTSNDLYLFDKLGEKYIKGNPNESDDTVFTSNLFSHLLDPSTVRYYSQRDPSNNGYGVMYPIMDHDDSLTSVFDIVNNYPVVPAMAAYQLFEKIITDAGFTFSISSDISTLITKLYIPLNNDNLAADYNYSKWFIGDNQPTSTPNRGQAVYQYVKKIVNVAVLNSENTLDPSIYFYRPAYSVPYWERDCSALGVDFGSAGYALTGYDYYINPPAGYYISGLRIPTGNILIDASLHFYVPDMNQSNTVNCFIMKYNSDGTIDEIDLGSVSNNDASSNYIFANKSVTINSTRDARIYLTLVPESTEGSFTTTIDLADAIQPSISFFKDTNIKLTALNTIYSKKTITINDILPTKYKKKDFINDILLMFNAYVISNDNHLTIRSYDDFNNRSARNIVDWSDRIVNDSISFEPIKNSFPKNIKIGYTTDGNKYDTDYISKYDVPFGTKILYNDSEFANDEEIIKISSAPTISKLLNSDYNVYSETPTLTLQTDNSVNFRWFDYMVLVRLRSLPSEDFIDNSPIPLTHIDGVYYGDGLINGSRDFNLLSNSSWRTRIIYNTVGDPWVSVHPGKGEGDSSCHIGILPNFSDRNRVATIYFYVNTTLFASKTITSEPFNGYFNEVKPKYYSK